MTVKSLELKVVYKYQIAPPGVVFEHDIPRSAEIVKIETQRGLPQMWVLVNPRHERVTRTFFSVGTGHEFTPPPGFNSTMYLGTFQLADGNLVYHVFEAFREEL